MAMSLMGYQTQFIHMTCLGLLASNNFTQKRLAYLGICMLLDENSEVLLLTSNIIKKDLSNNNQFIVAAALTAIDEISTPDMCRDTCPEVLKCLQSSNPYIKKKASLALIKIIRSSPELLETVAGSLKLVFEDKNHGVLLCGLALAQQVFKSEPKYIKKYQKYVPSLLRYLKNMISNSYTPEYDINGVCDPFLQVRILETLAIFAKRYSDENDELTNLLSSIPSNTDTSRKNTGFCVLYELVRTIFSFESSHGLKNIGSTILGQFLSNKDNNYKYLALNTLSDIAKIDISSVQKHKNVILEFLNDPDVAIKRRSLDLVFLIVNSSNIKQIVTESLNFLSNANNEEFINELSTKLFYSLEKYSPSLKYEIDTILKMLCLSENSVSDDIIWKISNLILKTRELQQYSMFKFFLAMRNNLEEGEEALIKVGITILGELFSLIINVSAVDEEGNNITITEDNILSLIEQIDNNPQITETTKEILMNTCFKMLGKVSKEGEERLKNILGNEAKSFFCEVQERANEYITFTQIANENIQNHITKNVPVPSQEFGIEKMNEIGEEPRIEGKEILVEEFENEKEKNAFINLINGASVNNQEGEIPSTGRELSNKQMPIINEQPVENKVSNQGTANLLDDFNSIFGPSQSNPISNNPPDNNTNQNNNDIFNLMGNLNLNNPQPQQQNPQNNLFPDLGSILTNPNQGSNNQMMDNNNNQGMNIFNMMDPSQQNSNIGNMGNIMQQPQIQQQPKVDGSMKEIFKNNEVTIYSMLNQNNDTYDGAFYISNNSPKYLTNVKLNFFVKKHVNFKVLSTSANELGPNASLGIKKEITMQNTDLTKQIVIKMSISYSADGTEIKDSKIINL